MKNVSLVPVLLVLSACASTDSDSSKVAPTPVAPPVASAPAPAPVAAKPVEPPKPVRPSLTSAQSDKLDKALNFKVSSSLLAKMIEQARPTIRDFVALNACIINDDGTPLNGFVAADKQLPARGYKAPVTGVAKHDRAACMTPASSQNWVAISKDHLRFDFNYQADTGEIEKVRHELKRQSNGKWLFVR